MKILFALILSLFIGCTNVQEDLVKVEGAATVDYKLGTRAHHTAVGATVTAGALYLKLPRMPITPSQQSNFVQGFNIGNFGANQQNSVEFKATRSPGHLQHVGNLWIWVGGDHYDLQVIGHTGPAGQTTGYPPTILSATAYPGDSVELIYNAAPEWLNGDTPRLEIWRDGASGLDAYLDTQTAWSPTPGTDPMNVGYDPYTIFTVNTSSQFGCAHDMPPADDDVDHIGSYDVQSWFWRGPPEYLTFTQFSSPTTAGCGLEAFPASGGPNTVQWYNP